MARIGQSLQALAAEIERRAESKKDFIAPVSKLHVEPYTVHDQSGVALAGDKNDFQRLLKQPVILNSELRQEPRIVVTNGKAQPFAMNEIAHGQLAEYAGIPMAYYRRMLEQDPVLLAGNVNRWLKDMSDEARMVRTLDNRCRAFLSNKYRTLENEDLAEVVLPVLLDLKLIIISCEITDRRLYIKAIDQRITRDVPTGKAMGDGSHVFFDTVSPGIVISNSEGGCGALSVETVIYTKACTNLAMMGTSLRKYHTGARAATTDEVYALLTDDTKRATDKAVWMQVRDLVRAGFDEAKFAASCDKLGAAAKSRIEPDQVVEVVERTGRRFSFNEGERKGILARLIEGGDLSRYGLHAAITRHSQEEAIAYDRSTEMERIGGEVIEMGANDWQQLLAKPYSPRREAVAA